MVSADDQLGLMIRGGAEFGLGIFVTGVLNNSVAFKLGLKVREMIELNIEGKPSLISFSTFTFLSSFSNIYFGSYLFLLLPNCGEKLTINLGHKSRIGNIECITSW